MPVHKDPSFDSYDDGDGFTDRDRSRSDLVPFRFDFVLGSSLGFGALQERDDGGCDAAAAAEDLGLLSFFSLSHARPCLQKMVLLLFMEEGSKSSDLSVHVVAV